jgi:hypothetical protein
MMTHAWAQPSDDGDLRQLLRDTPIPGRMSVSFERDPNFFAAAAIEGDPHTTLVVRNQHGELQGMASCAIRPRYVNGTHARIAYLSQLRSRPGAGGLAQARIMRIGYDMLRAWQAQQQAPFALMSIVSDNARAIRFLTQSVPGFPHARNVGRMHTHVIATRRKRRAIDPPPGYQLVPGSAGVADSIIACMQRNHVRYQFAPIWDSGALGDSGVVRWEDLLVLLKGDRVAGVVAVWDQRALKQTVVRGYAAQLARWRRLLNRVGYLAGVPHLPNPGQALNYAFISHVAIDDDDALVFAALLRAACNLAAQRGHEYVMLGLCEGHPLRAVVRAYHPMLYASYIYAVCWDNDRHAAAHLDSRMIDPEVAVL